MKINIENLKKARGYFSFLKENEYIFKISFENVGTDIFTRDIACRQLQDKLKSKNTRIQILSRLFKYSTLRFTDIFSRLDQIG